MQLQFTRCLPVNRPLNLCMVSKSFSSRTQGESTLNEKAVEKRKKLHMCCKQKNKHRLPSPPPFPLAYNLTACLVFHCRSNIFDIDVINHLVLQFTTIHRIFGFAYCYARIDVSWEERIGAIKRFSKTCHKPVLRPIHTLPFQHSIILKIKRNQFLWKSQSFWTPH